MATLPEFPRPDLPESTPENFPTLRIRVLRRLGLPDDGGMWINDTIRAEILAMYNGTIVNETRSWLDIAFPSLNDAVSWAECITATGHDRALVEFLTTPPNPYDATTLRIRIGR